MLPLQKLFQIMHRPKINTKYGRPEAPIFYRSNYRDGGHVQSWQGEWKLMILLPLQKLFQIIHRPKINIKIGRQEALSSTDTTTEMEDMSRIREDM